MLIFHPLFKVKSEGRDEHNPESILLRVGQSEYPKSPFAYPERTKGPVDLCRTEAGLLLLRISNEICSWTGLESRIRMTRIIRLNNNAGKEAWPRYRLGGKRKRAHKDIVSSGFGGVLDLAVGTEFQMPIRHERC